MCFTFFDLLVLLLAVSSLFFLLLFADVIFPLDDAGWTRAVLILGGAFFLFSVSPRMNRHFPTRRYLERVHD